MELLKNSNIIKIIDKLDIKDSCYEKVLKSSTFVQKTENIISFLSTKLSFLTSKSVFFKNLDYIILGLITLIFVCSLFTGTGLLGLLATIAFFLSVINIIISRSEQNLSTAFNIPVFMYFAIAAISVAFSYLLFPSLKGFSKMIVYLGSYLTFLSCINGKSKRMIYFIFMIGILTGTESLYAVCQQITGIEDLATWQDKTGVNPEQLMNRVYGSLKPFNPNLLAGYLVSGFASTLGCFFISLKTKKNLWAGLSIVGTSLCLISIILTGSRGAYIALAAMMFLIMILSGHIIWHDFSDNKHLKKIWQSSIIFGILGVLLLIIISPAIQHRITSIFAMRSDSSTSFRMNVYASTFKMFLDNWLIGIGPGNTTFRLMYGLYMITGFDALGAYCVPLEIAAEAGIFALISFVWLLLMSFLRALKIIIANTSFENKIIASVCIISLSGMMIHGMVDTVWYRPQIQFLFWLYISILAVVTSDRFKEANE